MLPWFSAQLLKETEISLLQFVPAFMAEYFAFIKAISTPLIIYRTQFTLYETERDEKYDSNSVTTLTRLVYR
jgi:hypothetical protein